MSAAGTTQRSAGSAESRKASVATVLRGLELEHSGAFEAAEACYRRAIAEDPSYNEARARLGFLLLALGDYGRAWPLLERRNIAASVGTAPPRWRGQNLRGKTIIVTGEPNGLGDHILFARFVRRLRAHGAARIGLMCPAPLSRLFTTLEGVDDVFPFQWVAGGHMHFDMPARPHYYSNLCSIPAALEARTYSIPAPPYLAANPADLERWRPRLPQAGLRVGLVWRGGAESRHDDWRSLPSLRALAPLWRALGVSFVSLQVGAGEHEARAGLPGQPLTHLGSELKDFADTAAILAQLDLLISVCTSTANLAGAMGLPVWVLSHATSDWRWRRPEWYPTARIFRQHRSGEWAGAINDAATALEALRAAREAA